MKHIFLSYAHDDLTLMRRVRKDLRAEGFTVWTDEYLIPGTPNWKQQVENALDTASCVVTIFTPNAKKSHWLKEQLYYAEAQDLRIFPILAKGTRKNAIPFGFITAKCADVRTDYISEMQRLIFMIRVHLNLIQIEQRTEEQKSENAANVANTANAKPQTHPSKPRVLPSNVSKAIMVLQNRESKWWRRVDAITHLGELGDPLAIPVLQAYLEDPDIDVQRAAERAIARIRLIQTAPRDTTEAAQTLEMPAAVEPARDLPRLSDSDEQETELATQPTSASQPPIPENIFKLVVTGQDDLLRTRFVRAISEIDVVTTERELALREASLRPTGSLRSITTKVSMSFGQITLADDLVLYLFSTPGERRFDFMWQTLAEGMLGFVVMVDGTRPDTFESVRGIIQSFNAHENIPYVVAVDNYYTPESWQPKDVRLALRLPGDVKVLACRSEDHDSVKRVLLALTYLIRERME